MIEPVSLLEVEGLSVVIPTRRGLVEAVTDVTFRVQPGERVGIVGESGSGKTMAALAILRLLLPPARITKGRVLFEGRDVLRFSPRELERFRGGQVGMIFQDPLTALNPYLRIGVQVGEMLEIHRGVPRHEALREAAELLRRVQISDPERRLHEYPHQLSGGMRQRVAIAIAMATRPKMIIADEPTTALDVTAQAAVLELLKELTEEDGTSVVLITHDLSVVADFCHRVIVLYAGRVVEEGRVDEILSSPLHPYTRALLRSIPRLDGRPGEEIAAIPGQPPSLIGEIRGCPFAPRCEVAEERCRAHRPPLVATPAGGRVACHVAAAALARREEHVP
jgi:oligopeptide/dipeptide ABC transporter ATP-binding protein